MQIPITITFNIGIIWLELALFFKLEGLNVINTPVIVNYNILAKENGIIVALCTSVFIISMRGQLRSPIDITLHRWSR